MHCRHSIKSIENVVLILFMVLRANSSKRSPAEEMHSSTAKSNVNSVAASMQSFSACSNSSAVFVSSQLSVAMFTMIPCNVLIIFLFVSPL